MSIAIALLPALPLAGSALLALAGDRLPARAIAAIAIAAVALAAILAAGLAAAYADGPADARYVASLWTWIEVGAFSPAVSFALDGLSAVMILVVTIVGALIHLYAAAYMRGDPGYRRFFAYMNLFVGFMLILVLADNLLLLYLGWEGVGLASYLLIGFWYEKPENGRAATKAFVVTRVGDTALAIGIFVLFWELGALDLATVSAGADAAWEEGDPRAALAAALILAGAAGKSAQVPLHVWLPDAMAGPTPVSALIHAATMVTAGVYLIARLHPVFEAAPAVLTAVAIVGAITLLVGALAALAQRDIKRVLAYSTISQLGYMVLALGAGAYAAAIAHLVTHAFFKAGLFLAAGVAVAALGGERDLARMGGLRRALPLPFWTFALGAASLAAIPIVTAGFYSKELILWGVWIAEPGGPALAAAVLAGSLLTAVYAFRALFLAFSGPPVAAAPAPRGAAVTAPLAVLAALSVIGGALETSPYLGGATLLSDLLGGALPAAEHGVGTSAIALMAAAAFLSLLGLAIAYAAFARPGGRRHPDARGPGRAARAAASGFGADAAYDRAIARPYAGLAGALRHDPVDLAYEGLARAARALHAALARAHDGRARVYLAILFAGAIALMAYAVLG